MTCRWHWHAGFAALLLVGPGPRPAFPGEPSLAELERSFHSLPAEARRRTGPLFWLHGDESPRQLRLELEKVAAGGNGTFTAESRPHSDWLGEGWFRDLGICLDAARRLDLTMWIFDEKWWPSGEVGGKVPSRYGSKYLEVSARHVTGPATVPPQRATGLPPNVITLLAGRDTGHGIDGASLIELSADRETALPAGTWSILTFRWRPSDGRDGRLLVDGASRDAIEWYIKTVYQPHYDRFGADFGKTIKGYFYDEPETPGDWGTEVIPELKRMGVDWKRAIVAHKLRLADPEEQTAASYQYRTAFAEAWGRTMYGGLARWCKEHRVQSMGHWLEHEHEYLNDRLCAGDMFQVQKYSDMGAIDAVFKQFAPGKRDDTYVTPKLGSSITHAYGKPDDVTMVEIFGARGQDLSYPEMKWWTDVMQVAGVNFLIPHSFNPRAPHDTDCPPYFYNGGHEPRFPLYRVFADYTSRLSLLLTGGRHVCPVAVLYAGQGYHFKPAVTPEDMTVALQDALYDSDWLPYDVFEKDTRFDSSSRMLALRQERYRVLVVPPVDVIPFDALRKVRDFYEQGGIVVGHGFLPTKSASLGHASAEITALREAVWGRDTTPSLTVKGTSPAGGRSYLLPQKPTPEQIQNVLANDAHVRPTLEVTAGDTNHWLHVLHRVRSGRDVFLVANLNHEGSPRTFDFRATAPGVPECWDALRNEITSLPFRRSGEAVDFRLTLEPLESVVIVFAPGPRGLPARIDAVRRDLRSPLPVVREPVVGKAQPDAPTAKRPELEGCSWAWYPEATDPAAAAPPGERYFRKVVRVPDGDRVVKATALLSADNSFVLHVNGQKTGESGMGEGDWTRPARIDITGRLRRGENVLAVIASNGSDRPNPAGLIGKVRLEFEGGAVTTVRVDESWKVSEHHADGWLAAGFDDSRWKPARIVAPFGGGPWKNTTTSELTLSPVKADPFVGRVVVPPDLLPGSVRLVLELEGLAPEEAARVTVNGTDAGGFIGRPLRLDVTSSLRPGVNRVMIEPFSPRTARVAILPR